MTRIVITDIDESAAVDSPEAWDGVKQTAGEIARVANATRAPIGITYREQGHGPTRRIVIGPRGAAAIAVEFGHQGVPGKKMVRRALDRFRRG